MKKLLLIKVDCLLKSFGSNWQFQKEAIQNLAQIAKQLDFQFVLVENHLSSLPVEAIRILENEQVQFAAKVLSSELNSFTNTLKQLNIANLEQVILVSKEQNSEAFFLLHFSSNGILHRCNNWNNVFACLKHQPRVAKTHRQTNETEIEILLNLDGNGKANIQTGIGFFDHMLEQIAKHGSVDLMVNAKGDLHIDEHHTIEDVAIALGETFHNALGAKKGIERYGFLLPMDDCLAQVAIDFGGRPWLVWEVNFNREKIGEMPTEMFFHFFKSFADNAKCNLNIKAFGENEHHKIEAIFKAFAKAIKMAISKNDSFSIPSTKGVL